MEKITIFSFSFPNKVKNWKKSECRIQLRWKKSLNLIWIQITLKIFLCLSLQKILNYELELFTFSLKIGFKLNI